MISDNGFDPVVRLRVPLLPCARLPPAMAAAAAAERAPAGWEPPSRILIGEEQYEYYYTCLP